MSTRIECNKIRPGIMFSQPVFFDDGKCMFLAAKHPAKEYHVDCLRRWKIPFLVTAGKELTEQEINAMKASEQKVSANANQNASASAKNDSDVEELEELDELEELEEI